MNPVQRLEMVVSELSPLEIDKLIKLYEFRISEAVLAASKANTYLESRIALKAADTAKKQLEFLKRAA